MDFFTDAELNGLQPTTVAGLRVARIESNVPYIITSGFRTPEKNSGLSGAVGNSSHLTGHAVDLAILNDAHLKAVIAGLLSAGFTRIGTYYVMEGTKLIPRHVHVDNDPTKPQNVMWAAIEQNAA